MYLTSQKVAPKKPSPSPGDMGRKLDTQHIVNPTYLDYRPWLNETDPDRLSVLSPVDTLQTDGLCRITEDNISMGKSDGGLLHRKHRNSQKIVCLNVAVCMISMASLVVTVLMLLGKITAPSCGCTGSADNHSSNKPPSMQHSGDGAEAVNRMLEQLHDNLTQLNGVLINQRAEMEKLRDSFSWLKEGMHEHSSNAKHMETTVNKNALNVQAVADEIKTINKQFDAERTFLRETTTKIWSNIGYVNNSFASKVLQIQDCCATVRLEVHILNETFSKKVKSNSRVIHGITVNMTNTKRQMADDRRNVQSAVANIWTGLRSVNHSTIQQDVKVRTLDARLYDNVTTLNDTFTYKVNSMVEMVWTTLKLTSENLQNTFDYRLNWALNQTKMAFNASMTELLGDVHGVNSSLIEKVFEQKTLLLDLTKSQEQNHRNVLLNIGNKTAEVNSLLKTFWTTLKTTTETLHNTIDAKLHWALNKTKLALESSMADILGDVQDVNRTLTDKISTHAVAITNLTTSQLETQLDLSRTGTSLNNRISESRTNLTRLKSSCLLLGKQMITMKSTMALTINSTESRWRESRIRLYDVMSNLNATLTVQINNMSKLHGPPGPPGSPGPPGINGSRGPPGQGVQQDNSSKPCMYKTTFQKIRSSSSASVDVVKVENEPNKKVISPYCSTNVASRVTLTERYTRSGLSRVFMCSCSGLAPTRPANQHFMYCHIHYYECPLITT